MKTIAIHAKDQLAPYLPTLVPRLFRYKYDPIPRIQLAMSSIWDAIVTDTKGTVCTVAHNMYTIMSICTYNCDIPFPISCRLNVTIRR